MKLTRYDSAADFLKHARAPLEVEEAANSLIVGIAARVVEPSPQYKFPAYLATVDEGETLVAAAVRTPPFRVIVYSSLGSDPAPLRLILDDLLDFTAAFPTDEPPGRLAGSLAIRRQRSLSPNVGQERTGRVVQTRHEPAHLRAAQSDAAGRRAGPSPPCAVDEVDLLADWIYNFNLDDASLPADRAEARVMAERRVDAGDFFIWEHEGSPCRWRQKEGPSSRGMTVTLVYTPRELRNRGYASACVAALSQQLLDAGWEFLHAVYRPGEPHLQQHLPTHRLPAGVRFQ